MTIFTKSACPKISIVTPYLNGAAFIENPEYMIHL